jgi:hypothetical protein
MAAESPYAAIDNETWPRSLQRGSASSAAVLSALDRMGPSSSWLFRFSRVIAWVMMVPMTISTAAFFHTQSETWIAFSMILIFAFAAYITVINSHPHVSDLLLLRTWSNPAPATTPPHADRIAPVSVLAWVRWLRVSQIMWVLGLFVCTLWITLTRGRIPSELVGFLVFDAGIFALLYGVVLPAY